MGLESGHEGLQAGASVQFTSGRHVLSARKRIGGKQAVQDVSGVRSRVRGGRGSGRRFQAHGPRDMLRPVPKSSRPASERGRAEDADKGDAGRQDREGTRVGRGDDQRVACQIQGELTYGTRTTWTK